MNSQLESLPTEILIECFEYLDGSDLLLGFNRLNQRFNQLLRHSRFYFDFQNISELSFDQILDDLVSDDHIKQQIYSIKLSNKQTHFQIESFLDRFSLDQFSNLRSLTLIDIARSMVSKLLPLPTTISCLHLYNDKALITIDTLPLTQLRTVTLPQLIRSSDVISTIRNLTVSKCSISSFFQILRRNTQLRYFNVDVRSPYADHLFTENYSHFKIQPAIHLKELNIKLPRDRSFKLIEAIVQRTPNLRTLTIYQNDCQPCMLSASSWQQLITTSLPRLKIFQIYFRCQLMNEDRDLTQFQTDFWQNECQWFIEYAVSNTIIEVYTVPFVFDRYRLPLHTVRYYTDRTNSSETFANVNELTIEAMLTRENFQYYFPFVTSLAIGDSSSRTYNIRRLNQYVDSLKMIVNLSNLRHLNIVLNSLKDPKILLEILNQTPDLCSLCIHSTLLESLLNNENIALKSINKLQINGVVPAFIKFNEYRLVIFCKIFSNLEYFICADINEKVFLYLLNNLSNLLRLTLHQMSEVSFIWMTNVEEKVSTLGFHIVLRTGDTFPGDEQSISILRKIF